MSEQLLEETDGATSPKSEWVRPELISLTAGGAELGDVSNPDGPGTAS